MGNVILGGLLAIVAGLAGHFTAHFLQSRRKERGRHHERCCVVHLDFACEFNRLRGLIEGFDHPWLEDLPLDLGYEVSSAMRNTLMAVQIFSPATYQAACTAVDHLGACIRADGKTSADPMNAAFEEYLAQARKELGVQRNPAARK